MPFLMALLQVGLLFHSSLFQLFCLLFLLASAGLLVGCSMLLQPHGHMVLVLMSEKLADMPV